MGPPELEQTPAAPENPAAEPVPAAAAQVDHLRTTVIERQPGWRFIDPVEIWRYRELLFFFVWRDVKVRYKQTVLGALWAILQPFGMMVVFSLFFGRLAELHSGALPYPLFVFAGLLPWFFFSNAISSAASSVVGNQNLISKVYFPRLMIPLGAVLTALVDLAVASVMLVVMFVYYHCTTDYQFTATWKLLLLPVLVVALTLAAFGVGTLMAALTVAYRDFRYVVSFLVQMWMFATPAIYLRTSSELNPRWGLALPLNPADGLIRNLRASLVGSELDLYALTISLLMSLFLLLIGCSYFQRVERGFADVI